MSLDVKKPTPGTWLFSDDSTEPYTGGLKVVYSEDPIESEHAIPEDFWKNFYEALKDRNVGAYFIQGGSYEIPRLFKSKKAYRRWKKTRQITLNKQSKIR